MADNTAGLSSEEIERADELAHAKVMLIFQVAKIRHFIMQGRDPARVGFEAGLAYRYYETIMVSDCMSDEKDTSDAMAREAYEWYGKYLDEIIPMRLLLK